jgi:hypothetical protein
MVVMTMMGGLGNQLFQYATGRALSLRLDQPLYLEETGFGKRTQNQEHTYQLKCFMHKAIPLKGGHWARVKARLGWSSMLGTLLKKDGAVGFSEPPGSSFKEEVMQLSSPVHLRGHFMSFRYFDEIRSTLLEDLCLEAPLSERSKRWADEASRTSSVSIHYRRGDFVSNPSVAKSVEGILTETYYRNAVDEIMGTIENPHFYVFSNDMPWVKKNVSLPGKVTFVEGNGSDRGYEDLWVMSRCRHHILAGGSTFSWWAAYLNPREDKKVIRTEKVNNEEDYNYPDDFFPPSWKSVPS